MESNIEEEKGNLKMKRFFILLAVAAIFQTIAFGQKKYEMVIEKTDGSETVINVEDIVRTYFRERTNTNVSYTTCPDNNHPHMIDLGLPSGTKWACCNVGASAPEDYGNYYAWGETQPKSVYNYYCPLNTDLQCPTSLLPVGGHMYSI